MIFQWPAAQQANVITVAGPMPLSLPSTMLLAPGHHVIVGFAFWNTGAALQQAWGLALLNNGYTFS